MALPQFCFEWGEGGKRENVNMTVLWLNFQMGKYIITKLECEEKPTGTP